MIRPVVHMLAHLVVPGLIARLGFGSRWRIAWGVMVATMLVDLDHLLADPIFDPDRCSLGFHPLHTPAPIALYAVLACTRRLRAVGVGLLVHMALDGLDCLWMHAD